MYCKPIGAPCRDDYDSYRWWRTKHFNGMGIPVHFTEPITAEQEAVLWFIRMPRLIIGLLVGGALALAGAVMQGVFSNPLADPGIMGVSAGASLGAVIAIALGVTSLGMFYMPTFAFIGAFISVGITILLTLRNNKLDTTTLLLAGVAVSMLLGAFTSGILTMINEYRLREFLFWMVGGLDFRRWDHVALAVGPIMTGSVILMMLGRHLNVLVLGDTEHVHWVYLLWCTVCYSYSLHLSLQLPLYVSVVLSAL